MVKAVKNKAVKQSRRSVGSNRHCTPEMRARVRDWIEREIEFVEHPEFSDPEFAQKLDASRLVCHEEATPASPSQPAFVFVTGLVDAPLLTPGEEVGLFKWMNFLKYRAEQSRRQLDLTCPNFSLVERIESDLSDALAVRNRIVRSNLRLVVALARKLSVSIDQMSELISESTMPLIRAVELFDIGLGNRFSTYATWAVRNHMLRCLKRRHVTQERTVVRDQVWLDRLTDDRTNPDEEARLSARRVESVQQLLTSLNERERAVISARFGLEGQPRGQSLQDIAERIGLSKERVRQIAIAAIVKMQGIVKTTGCEE